MTLAVFLLRLTLLRREHKEMKSMVNMDMIDGCAKNQKPFFFLASFSLLRAGNCDSYLCDLAFISESFSEPLPRILTFLIGSWENCFPLPLLGGCLLLLPGVLRACLLSPALSPYFYPCILQALGYCHQRFALWAGLFPFLPLSPPSLA